MNSVDVLRAQPATAKVLSGGFSTKSPVSSVFTGSAKTDRNSEKMFSQVAVHVRPQRINGLTYNWLLLTANGNRYAIDKLLSDIFMSYSAHRSYWVPVLLYYEHKQDVFMPCKLPT